MHTQPASHHRASDFSVFRPRQRLPLALAILTALCIIPGGEARAELETPRAGWRQGDPDTPYTQTVNYPAVMPGIDADTPEVGQIRGRIRENRKQATLIVNGNAMPVRVGEDNTFARPYSFPAGSNSVEVRAGDERLRTQFYHLPNGQAQAKLRLILSWDTDGSDLDLHVITPSGEHAWYGQRVIASGAIDTDVTTGYGPEIFSAPNPERGLYQVYVNYYGSGNDSGALTSAHLTVIGEEGTANEKRQEFTVPLRFSGEILLVRQFMYP
jgi:uncharacterized protein YfaP (DUF2135 family)